MKTIIAGSRTIMDYNLLCRVMQGISWEPTVILSGGEPNGVDRLGEEWAKRNNIECEIWRAYWNVLKKSAGPIRNEQMASVADALVAIWDGKTRGTKNMIENARKRKLRIFIEEIK